MRTKSLIFFLTLTSVSVLFLYWVEAKKILASDVNAWTTPNNSDCGVVLTGGPGRIREGFDLLSQHRIRKLIIAGVYPGAELREIFPNWPFYGFLNEHDVILEKHSGTTYGNAVQSLPLVEALGCRSVVVITSRLHVYRASRIFSSVFSSKHNVSYRSVVGNDFDPTWSDIWVETTKSLFYRLLAY